MKAQICTTARTEFFAQANSTYDVTDNERRKQPLAIDERPIMEIQRENERNDDENHSQRESGNAEQKSCAKKLHTCKICCNRPSQVAP